MRKMTFNKIIIAGISAMMALTACVDEIAVGDSFLEKQPGVDVTLDTIFSKAEYAKMFLWDNYKYLYNQNSSYNTINATTPESLTDCMHSILGWSEIIAEYYKGMHTAGGNDGYCRDKFAWTDGNSRAGIWTAVRKSWIFIENIDRVPDMSPTEKARLKAEARLIIASRYYDALCHFGGLPIVDHSYQTGEDFEGGYISGVTGEGEYVKGRASVIQTATFIDNILQQVIDEQNLPFSIIDYANEGGRLTKGGAYALRAKLWCYVASPLFNSDIPYMTYTSNGDYIVPENGDPQLAWWIGRYDSSLWEKCLKACEDFFRANDAAGKPYAMVKAAGPTENAYRQAFRNAYFCRSNTEKIIEVRGENNGHSDGEYLKEWGYNYPGNVSHYGANAPTLEFFELFPWANGKNFDGQKVYNTTNEENLDIFANRDPRLYETMLVPQKKLDNNFNTYQDKYIDPWVGGGLLNDCWWFTSGYMAHGFGQFKWVLDYWDLSNERWSFPYLRMSDMHLTYAEALAQNGRIEEAINEVDKVRGRVGLPSLRVNTDLCLTDKDVFINELLRERQCELSYENSRLLDLIRYKRVDLFTKPLHMITVHAKDPKTGQILDKPLSRMRGVWPAFTYETEVITQNARVWWQDGGWSNKWLLSPIGRTEINKGYGLYQNPGW